MEAINVKRLKARARNLPKGLKLAFCPGASPPDNSCPPTNKGTGKGPVEPKHLGNLITKLAKEDGFTFDPKTSSFPEKGFAVSIVKNRERVLEGNLIATVSDFKSYVEDNKDFLSEPNANFGGWYNKDDGKVYLDVSIVVDTQEEATKLALEHKQLAIFDLVKKDTIYVTKN